MSAYETNSKIQKTPIFAYLRRSTTKKEQEDSLPQQSEGIEHISTKLWIDIEKIQKFTESKSGFENRKRIEWKAMLKAIDSSKEPCIILVRDTSRLSRNPKDNLEIANRIFWDNNYKKKISKIYFIGEKFEIIEWNEQTNKKYIVDTLHQNYTNSLETKDKSITGIILKLQSGEFPYATPKWLENVIDSRKRILTQNAEMPFIRRAFEMKAEGKNHKDISSFLLKSWNIRIFYKDLTDRLFKNEVYIWEYTEKTTLQHFKNLKFLEGKPPISMELWDNVQKCLWRQISHYGDKQEGHIFEAKIKSESGHLFSKYIAKGHFPNYKGRFVNAEWKARFIHISEKAILRTFMVIMKRVISVLANEYSIKFDYEIHKTVQNIMWEVIDWEKSDTTFEKFQKTAEMVENYKQKWQFWIQEEQSKNWFLDELRHGMLVTSPLMTLWLDDQFVLSWKNYLIDEKWMSETSLKKHLHKLFLEKKKEDTTSIITEEEFSFRYLCDLWEVVFHKEWTLYIKEEDRILSAEKLHEQFEGTRKEVSNTIAAQNLAEILRKKYSNDSTELKKAKEGQAQKYQKEKEKVETERKDYRKNAVIAGFSKAEIDEISIEMDRKLKRIDEAINELLEESEMEKYLRILPDILIKTVELADSIFNKGRIEGMRSEIQKLIEMTTVELIIRKVNKEKSLTVRLFSVIETLIPIDKDVLEAPSGVEPDYGALQAPA